VKRVRSFIEGIQQEPYTPKTYLHILSKDVLRAISFLDPDLNLEMKLAGFDMKTLLSSAAKAQQHISSGRCSSGYYARKPMSQVHEWRDEFMKECWRHSSAHHLPYNYNLVKLLTSKYDIFDGVCCPSFAL